MQPQIQKPTLDDAIVLAVQAHRGQVDKAGEPYISHPLRVMARVRGAVEQIAAVLHDVVEDSPYTLDDLRRLGYGEELVAAVDCLTRRNGETYEQFIARVMTNPAARRVKLADLKDNMDIRRLGDITEKDRERLARYRAAWAALMADG